MSECSKIPSNRILVLNETNETKTPANEKSIFARLFYENEFVVILNQWNNFGRKRLVDLVASAWEIPNYRMADEKENAAFFAGLREAERTLEPFGDAPEEDREKMPEMNPLFPRNATEVAVRYGNYFIEAHFGEDGVVCYRIFNRDYEEIDNDVLTEGDLYAAVTEAKLVLENKGLVHPGENLAYADYGALLERVSYQEDILPEEEEEER